MEFDNMKHEQIQKMDAKDKEIESLKDIATDLKNRRKIYAM